MKVIKILLHASIWFAPVLIPLILWLLASERELKRLSLQALVFHFVIWLLVSISYFFSFILIGLPFLVIFGLIGLIAPIMGIIRAIQDRSFHYPLIGSWIR
ncbi:MAG: DUF4870 domain-containing protein [Firmicutes bacterium]|uniref:DUF4870 domain-containing protein n=1 Tax=Melghirimyces thermohalophilus TaxID=1236220 RepID=A0A1G6NAV3_9BACL|nr:DUF4870 domain-containing protein [Melghirimyces thermohalophilus]MDA8353001.1 DUF4870 domain-containing protein [Bacillota bacterium]SDC64962.1 hypothetical protein SAMN04488112_11280 [Melghirimyces thermohalophilus]